MTTSAPLIMKFGGTSMGDPDRIKHAATLVKNELSRQPVVTVVSAMSGVTDQLLELADAAAAGNRAASHLLLGQLRQRHESAANALGASDAISTLLDQLDRLMSGIAAVGEITPRSRDAAVSFGERLSAPLMAAALKGVALTGKEAGIITDDAFGRAEPLMDLTLFQVRETLQPLLNANRPVVVTGFIAATQHGVTTALGRGGSDYTATILGSALKAHEIWIWSDVDGLMTANPKMVPNAKLLDSITFEEALEMGQFGAKSMHPRALEPAAENRIPVRMRNSFNPTCEGTAIRDGATTQKVARAILSLPKTALITVSGAAMVGRPGTAAGLFKALAEREVNVLMISQSVSEAGISIVVAGCELDQARAAIESKLLRTGSARHIDIDSAATVIAVVGSNMRGTPGVAAKIFSAIARQGVNVIAIAQGSSQLSVSFVVSAADGPKTVQALHDEFELGK